MTDIPDAVLKRINGSPALLSFLYDVDLLPEQVSGEKIRTMILVVAAFDAAWTAAREEAVRVCDDLADAIDTCGATGVDTAKACAASIRTALAPVTHGDEGAKGGERDGGEA